LDHDDDLLQEVRDAGIDISELAGLDRRDAIAVRAGAAGSAAAPMSLVVAFAPYS
jgi:post-segregation antitoxin (ccd killing protein)